MIEDGLMWSRGSDDPKAFLFSRRLLERIAKYEMRGFRQGPEVNKADMSERSDVTMKLMYRDFYATSPDE
jgi:hypothetical protein